MDIAKYYNDPLKLREITEYLKGRWIGLEGENRKWVRWEDDKPLIISKPEDIPRLFKKYRFIRPRSIYGTIEVFKTLEKKADVMEKYVENVVRVTPFIDIDLIDERELEKRYVYIVRTTKIIADYVIENNIEKCVYLAWSGAGIHVRFNEKCIDEPLKEYHPLDVAFCLVEYVLEVLKPRLIDAIRESGGIVKIENLVSMKRVFTAPLSLHRRLDRAVIFFRPRDLEDFKLEWSDPSNPRHDPDSWRIYEKSGLDELAYKAIKHIGIVRKHSLLEARATRIGVETREPPTVEKPISKNVSEPGRFPVMALLQAARYYILTGDLEKAKSFGLNRAIFYAWAKYYGPAKRGVAAYRPRGRIYGVRVTGELKRVEEVGEKLQISPRGYFVMGGIEQRPEDFDRYVLRKFEEAGIKAEEAWRAALEYVRRFPKTVLRDPQLFYKEVYEPVRDRFVEKVLKRKQGGGEGIMKWLGKTK